MYDNEEYGAKRDSGFSLFYMFINVGAMLLLHCYWYSYWYLGDHGFEYSADLPALCHQTLSVV